MFYNPTIPAVAVLAIETVANTNAHDFTNLVINGGMAVAIMVWFMKYNSKHIEDTRSAIADLKETLLKQSQTQERTNRVRLLELINTTSNSIVRKQAQNELSDLDDGSKPPFPNEPRTNKPRSS